MSLGREAVVDGRDHVEDGLGGLPLESLDVYIDRVSLGR